MRVIFVCYGNICRSPMAEAFLRRAVDRRPALRGVEVASMGVGASPGRAATDSALDVLRNDHEIDLTAHRARQLDASVEADLILGLDRRTTALAANLAPGAPIEMLGDYAGSGEEVADPYGLSRDAYTACARHLAGLIDAVADRLEARQTT